MDLIIGLCHNWPNTTIWTLVIVKDTTGESDIFKNDLHKIKVGEMNFLILCKVWLNSELHFIEKYFDFDLMFYYNCTSGLL